MYLGTREDDGSGGTKTKQGSFPGGADYADATIDGTKSAVTNVTSVTTLGTVTIVPTGAGIEVQKTVAGVDYTAQVHYGGTAFYDSSFDPVNAAASIGPGASSVGHNKLAWDANGRITKYDNLGLLGKGIPTIINRFSFKGQTAGMTFAPLDANGNHVSGLLRLNIIAEFHIAVLPITGKITITAQYTRDIGVAVGYNFLQFPFDTVVPGAIVLDAGGLTAVGACSPVFQTDGLYSASGGITGLTITVTVNTAFSNCSYNLYGIVEKLDDVDN